ncbi:hypothetical protein CHUAL_006825 [Chamberlinius hualienensis]
MEKIFQILIVFVEATAVMMAAVSYADPTWNKCEICEDIVQNLIQLKEDGGYYINDPKIEEYLTNDCANVTICNQKAFVIFNYEFIK